MNSIINVLVDVFMQEHWIAPRKDGEKGCVVLLEGDPPATSGRMSFQGFSTDATAAKGIGKDGAAEVPLEGVSVGDEAMAEKLGNKTKKKKHSKKKAEPEQFHRGVKKFKSKK